MPLRHVFSYPRGYQAGRLGKATVGEGGMTAMRWHCRPRSFTRRAFVFGASLAGGGLVLGLPPARAGAETELVNARKRSEVTVWVAIERDDTVHIRVARSEMG